MWLCRLASLGIVCVAAVQIFVPRVCVTPALEVKIGTEKVYATRATLGNFPSRCPDDKDERPETKQSWVCAQAEATRSGASTFMAMSRGRLRAR